MNTKIRSLIRIPVGLGVIFLALLLPGTVQAAPSGDWSMWQYDAAGSRYNPNENVIKPANVGNLQLKWAFAFPAAVAASSQPAVVGGTVYVGGRDGKMYALDAKSGAQKWAFDAHTTLGHVPTYGLRDGPAVAGGTVFFGDNSANLWAVDAQTGAQKWVRQLDTHPWSIITSSPLVVDGTVYIGTSSQEEGQGANPLYACCTFRGSVAAVDAVTGALKWQHFTIAAPQPTGGTPAYAPSGGAVWSSPTIDRNSRTLFYTTGNPYTGTDVGAEAIVALNMDTGAQKWVNQLTPNDTWNVRCLTPPAGGNCPVPGRDFDFGTQPNVFTIDGRLLVGAGQKTGIYHLLDGQTGQLVWQSQLSVPQSPIPGAQGAESLAGIQWGAAYDANRLYVATYQANPGKLFALDPRDGHQIWSTPNPATTCPPAGGVQLVDQQCRAMPNAVSATPGLVWEGSVDGHIRAFSADTGAIVWDFNTLRPYLGANLIPGTGGSLNGNGAVIANGMLYTNSGYLHPITQGLPGNVLLAFGLP
ncbi:outer membrane protein assembly factor BamB family protein [Nocardia pseudobrasiliensis]|uniref:Polyvinyl alcohol dehydrogenase (Cytochrome) n=1 Tax=Nocardia pseudobrasiliensis TaxID=45979 RepID=A0A370IC75_9NOCA|nr:PQQ-binding-like beta-propeller repeat protein [Nocardia pseudobrasiliensis]RDI68342.1 polyvinyl alcohol dehydrogenase (cytochrome) [Nocardia pseudobrasiliensis]